MSTIHNFQFQAIKISSVNIESKEYIELRALLFARRKGMGDTLTRSVQKVDWIISSTDSRAARDNKRWYEISEGLLKLWPIV